MQCVIMLSATMLIIIVLSFWIHSAVKISVIMQSVVIPIVVAPEKHRKPTVLICWPLMKSSWCEVEEERRNENYQHLMYFHSKESHRCLSHFLSILPRVKKGSKISICWEPKCSCFRVWYFVLGCVFGCHDTQHNDIEHNDIHHNHQ